MVTIRDYINKCKLVNSMMLDEQERIVMANETKIIRLNVDAFQDGIGSDGKILKNSNKKFSGRYTLYTQLIAESQNTISPKIAGELYNFEWNGDFISNLQIDMQPDLIKFDIFSTGTGSGKKSLFFKGYTNIYGLDKKDRDIVNYKRILPELMTFIKKYL